MSRRYGSVSGEVNADEHLDAIALAAAEVPDSLWTPTLRSLHPHHLDVFNATIDH